MKRTQVAREVRDALHTTEASLDATIASTRAAIERMLAAKAEMGLTGTIGDAALARMQESLAAMEEARASMIDGHQEIYAIMKALDLRTVAGPTYNIDTEGRLDQVA
jgi:hypothetical protein